MVFRYIDTLGVHHTLSVYIDVVSEKVPLHRYSGSTPHLQLPMVNSEGEVPLHRYSGSTPHRLDMTIIEKDLLFRYIDTLGVHHTVSQLIERMMAIVPLHRYSGSTPHLTFLVFWYYCQVPLHRYSGSTPHRSDSLKAAKKVPLHRYSGSTPHREMFSRR